MVTLKLVDCGVSIGTDSGFVEFKPKRTNFNLADMFTKPVNPSTCRTLLSYLTSYQQIDHDGNITIAGDKTGQVLQRCSASELERTTYGIDGRLRLYIYI